MSEAVNEENAEEQAAANALRAEAERKERDDVRSFMRSPAGRRFVWRQLVECHVFATTYVANSDETQFNEGRRAHGLWLLSVTEGADKANFTLMLKENNLG